MQAGWLSETVPVCRVGGNQSSCMTTARRHCVPLLHQHLLAAAGLLAPVDHRYLGRGGAAMADPLGSCVEAPCSISALPGKRPERSVESLRAATADGRHCRAVQAVHCCPVHFAAPPALLPAASQPLLVPVATAAPQPHPPVHHWPAYRLKKVIVVVAAVDAVELGVVAAPSAAPAAAAAAAAVRQLEHVQVLIAMLPHCWQAAAAAAPAVLRRLHE